MELHSLPTVLVLSDQPAMKWGSGPHSFSSLAFLKNFGSALTPETIKKERKLKTEGHELEST